MIFWQPTGDDRLAHPTKYSYQSIVNGEWDAYLTSWAQDAKAWGGRVIVRWAHEMNGWWFPWAIGKIGNTPENYRAAWRHVVTTVRGIAPNVRFMWAPMRPCGTRCVDYAALYPGDAYELDRTSLFTSEIGQWVAVGFDEMTATSSMSIDVTGASGVTSDGMCTEGFAGSAFPIYPDSVTFFRFNRENSIIE